MQVVTLSLISHTNVGKTTLARTLLRRDVGQVLDQAHVTESSEVFELVRTDESALRLWDTPGLGDSARLVKRLKASGNPIGWFLHQVWDRHRDRPLYSSQQAIRNMKEEADVVLYLVNAAEDPAEAGYVPHEMEMLAWIDKPVIVLLNQTGREDEAERVSRWRDSLARWPLVRGLQPLDAFTRCWVQENMLLDKIAALLPADIRPAMEQLAAAWLGRNLQVFDRSVGALARYLAQAAQDGEPLAGQGLSPGEKRRAMRVLAQRLDDATADLMDGFIESHGLSGRFRNEARERLRVDFNLPGETAWTSGRTTLLGAAMGGAAGGLLADVAVAGLSFGTGAVAGAILGAASAAGLRRGYQVVRAEREPQVSWAREFLEQLLKQSLLRYLAVAHFGRGRGEWRDVATPERWGEMLEAAMAVGGTALGETFEGLRSTSLPDRAPAVARLEAWIAKVLLRTLRDAYPAAGESATFQRLSEVA